MLDAKENLEEDLDLGCDNNFENFDQNQDLQETFDKSSIMDSEDENKVFYLFTRTAREKEEWFNHLLVSAQFMEDWERQNPKEGSPVDSNYETQKVGDLFLDFILRWKGQK